MNNKLKYPRTLHLPNSPGITNDDKMLQDLSVLNNRTWVITEKMDGENTTMMRDCIYARSLDSNNHPSRNWVKGLWGSINYMIPKGWRICGENMYAKHSIKYNDLESYFLVFSIWNENNKCLSWDETLEWCSKLNLIPVKIYGTDLLGKRVYQTVTTFSKLIPKLNIEGFVIRNQDSFHYNYFQENVFKWVRADHVQTDEHWSNNKIIKNKLK